MYQVTRHNNHALGICVESNRDSAVYLLWRQASPFVPLDNNRHDVSDCQSPDQIALIRSRSFRHRSSAVAVPDHGLA